MGLEVWKIHWGGPWGVPGWILGFPPSVIIRAQAQKPTKSGLRVGGWTLEGMKKWGEQKKIKKNSKIMYDA